DFKAILVYGGLALSRRPSQLPRQQVRGPLRGGDALIRRLPEQMRPTNEQIAHGPSVFLSCRKDDLRIDIGESLDGRTPERAIGGRHADDRRSSTSKSVCEVPDRLVAEPRVDEVADAE